MSFPQLRRVGWGEPTRYRRTVARCEASWISVAKLGTRTWRAIPGRTKEQAEAQFAACFERVSLPTEVRDFLMEDKRLYFHDFPQVQKKVTVTPEGKQVSIALGNDTAYLDWDPFSEIDTVSIELLNRMDIKACANCLRGSLEPNHLMHPIAMLEEEATCWSPSFDFIGMNRSFLRTWACSEDCRLEIKWGVHRSNPLKALSRSVTLLFYRKMVSLFPCAYLLIRHLKRTPVFKICVFVGESSTRPTLIVTLAFTSYLQSFQLA